MVQPQRSELLKKRVEHLLPAFLDGDLSYLSTFLATYTAFATTQELLDQLLQGGHSAPPQPSGIYPPPAWESGECHPTSWSLSWLL